MARAVPAATPADSGGRGSAAGGRHLAALAGTALAAGRPGAGAPGATRDGRPPPGPAVPAAPARLRPGGTGAAGGGVPAGYRPSCLAGQPDAGLQSGPGAFRPAAASRRLAALA